MEHDHKQAELVQTLQEDLSSALARLQDVRQRLEEQEVSGAELQVQLAQLQEQKLTTDQQLVGPFSHRLRKLLDIYGPQNQMLILRWSIKIEAKGSITLCMNTRSGSNSLKIE